MSIIITNPPAITRMASPGITALAPGMAAPGRVAPGMGTGTVVQYGVPQRGTSVTTAEQQGLQPAGGLQSAAAPGATVVPVPGLPPFKSIEKALLPLEGKQIVGFRGKVRKTQDAGNQPIIPKDGTTQVITIDPDTGQTPTIHMAAGYACSITVVDSMGQPWPINTASVGDGGRFKVQSIMKTKESPTIVVSDLLPHAQSNLLLTLEGLNTPIPVQLVSGGPIKNGHEVVAYRVILRVRGMTPGALPPSFMASPNAGTTRALLQALYGTMPSAAKTLRVSQAPAYSHTRAWLLNGDLWIRTHATLLAPSWIAAEQSANGVHAYVLPTSHAVLLRMNGTNATTEIHHG
ncbi:hypothetical protein JKG47_04270 [Acidithiobacillus sp. MC6.1]|nr:hypothetical protein [Acidithiobacillus sp. MC6.1]